jgi:hypothetical protein
MKRTIMSALALIPLGLVLAAPAHALTAKECSVKYQAAQKAGTLNGQKWNDFRKAECSEASAASPAAATSPATTTAAPKPATTTAAPKAPASAAPARTTSAAPGASAAGAAVFPSSVSPKYSSESAGKARMHTCLDQYNANKAGNGNGGMKWIEKGGGYYSQCNSRLKG